AGRGCGGGQDDVAGAERALRVWPARPEGWSTRVPGGGGQETAQSAAGVLFDAAWATAKLWPVRVAIPCVELGGRHLAGARRGAAGRRRRERAAREDCRVDDGDVSRCGGGAGAAVCRGVCV